MKTDRGVRGLAALDHSASTARVLNLLATHRRLGEDPQLAAAPFFANRLLDRSIILKHRLRPHEYSHFTSIRSTATKLLIPIDGADLKAGARAVFIGQADFDEIAATVFGDDLKPGSPDRRVLELLDCLPSLDPFLLSEHLRTNGFEPARAYFGISAADVRRMYDFVRDEIMALVQLSSGPAAGALHHASRLVEKLLSDSAGGFEPLKQTLRLSDQEYLHGVFAWRGFLYYKWVLGELNASVEQVMAEVAQVMPRGPKDPEAAAYIPQAKVRLRMALGQTMAEVRQTLDIYDKAYASLTEAGRPMAFKDFLLSAPSLFSRLGEQLGGVQHIVSFWRYRFPHGRPQMIGPGELQDVLLDFEDSLAFGQEQPARTWLVA
jgi:hypothetical protein